MTHPFVGHEILTPAEMYKADVAAVTRHGIRSERLMEAAGKSVAQEIVARFKKTRTAVLCGPGNNGGDGFVVARLLKAANWPVDVYLWGERGDYKGDAAVMSGKWKGPVKPIKDFTSAKLIVDALFGAGLSRDFPQIFVDQIERVGAPILAIDVPSGLDGLSGRPRGACLNADVTVTFFRKKPAHVLYPGRGHCGEIVVSDIGIPDSVLESDVKTSLYENVPPRLPSPAADAHKYSRGAALVYSGDELHTGAARLAALAAARSGAGAVSICGTKDALRVHATHVSSIMLKTMIDVDFKKVRAACIGPAAGVGMDTWHKVEALLGSGVSLVLDADALTSFESDPQVLFELIHKSPCGTVVLTPHEGEFSRLFKDIAASDKPKHEKARAAARQSGAIVIYKGPDTVIAHPDGAAVINTNGIAALATAGSGDVLAGILTGMLAQGMDGLAAASAAVWVHAEAARRCTRRAPVAEDFIEAL